MAKDMVKIYNKGKRAWPLEWKEPGKTKNDLPITKKVICNPSRSIEVPKAVAARMIKNYPNDFLEGEALASTSSADLKKLKSENTKLQKELTAKDEKIDDLEAQLEELTAPVEDGKKSAGADNGTGGE